ncbi:response regulator transcription factor [Luteimonas fraxinea]|uniref:Response regulator transcription factor n=1 Tax=Luteimonas fraxinea TaxID=2901869 RepID=A0ABS8UFD9_9GAMM|nr:response regulator transcription factor [Luteimonas fraxinea]MCD9098188.1 response regulator transcription factor [Luteimonas fraxinea]MCD9126914.1 response regulator transcription factor [Luteimonas fraxinea]UHH08870.1 response regulator transcription factor [Luteimonas fraxinea]
MHLPDPIRVLVVDDDADYRDRFLAQGLRPFGFEAVTCGTVAEFRSLIAAENFQLAIVDLSLPDGNGFEISRLMRAQLPGVGTVMLSADEKIQNSIRGLQEGADAYLFKSAHMDVIAGTLHALRRRIQTPVTEKFQGDWALTADGWCLTSPRGCIVALTQSERQICRTLMTSRGACVDRLTLTSGLTAKPDEFDERRLDGIISRFRSKVLRSCNEALPIHALHGRGYQFG